MSSRRRHVSSLKRVHRKKNAATLAHRYKHASLNDQSSPHLGSGLAGEGEACRRREKSAHDSHLRAETQSASTSTGIMLSRATQRAHTALNSRSSLGCTARRLRKPLPGGLRGRALQGTRLQTAYAETTCAARAITVETSGKLLTLPSPQETNITSSVGLLHNRHWPKCAQRSCWTLVTDLPADQGDGNSLRHIWPAHKLHPMPGSRQGKV